jgi:hypothetical protein
LFSSSRSSLSLAFCCLSLSIAALHSHTHAGRHAQQAGITSWVAVTRWVLGHQACSCTCCCHTQHAPLLLHNRLVRQRLRQIGCTQASTHGSTLSRTS